MEYGNRECKLTEKALAYKVEKLQNERKGAVNKIKRLIPETKCLMKQKENVSQIKDSLGKLNKLFHCANIAQDELLPLLPQEEVIKQKEWFTSIMKYTETFQNDVKQWIENTEQNSNEQGLIEMNDVMCTEVNENEQQNSHGQIFTEPEFAGLESSRIKTLDKRFTEDDIEPSDSASNTGNHKSSQSLLSTASSARLTAEAELAALTARQQLLKERHALEEEEERLRKRKENLQLETEIAENIAKLAILKSKSTISGSRTSKVSDGMNSYFENSKPLLNANAPEFTPAPAKQKSIIKKDEKPSVKYNERTHATYTINYKAPQCSIYREEPIFSQFS